MYEVIDFEISDEELKKSILAYMYENKFRPASICHFHATLEANEKEDMNSILNAAGASMFNEFCITALEFQINKIAVENMINSGNCKDSKKYL